MVLKCSCQHPFQDERYGKGKRWHNPTLKQPVGFIYRCTVCGKERNEKGDAPVKKGKAG